MYPLLYGKNRSAAVSETFHVKLIFPSFVYFYHPLSILSSFITVVCIFYESLTKRSLDFPLSSHFPFATDQKSTLYEFVQLYGFSSVNIFLCPISIPSVITTVPLVGASPPLCLVRVHLPWSESASLMELERFGLQNGNSILFVMTSESCVIRSS